MSTQPIYILGAGAIGFPLAAHLAGAGRPVIAVRTSRPDLTRRTTAVTVAGGDREISAAVETASLAQLPPIAGTLVVTSKAHANPAIAQALAERGAAGPIVVMQNGVGVEQPFLDAGFPEVYRCVLYITGQTVGEHRFVAYAVKPSPIGIIRGDEAGLGAVVRAVHTEAFPFRAEAAIQREIWKKAITNAVFNSVCALLDEDAGVFVRNEAAAQIAHEVVRECVALTERLGLDLGEGELMEQIRWISRTAGSQLPSTVQDLRHGRPTEIDALNLAIARVAAAQRPALALPRTELLGRLVVALAERGGR